MVNKRPGRPSGSSDARQRLVTAAQRLLSDGHPATITARQIAEEAGLSHSLVNYHFGSKDELLIAALALTVAPHHVVTAATEHGTLDVRALAEGIVMVWEHPVHGPRLVAFARELATDGARAQLLSRYLERTVFGALAEAVGRTAARRLAVVIVGTIFTRYVLALPMMSTQSPAEVVGQIVALAGRMPAQIRMSSRGKSVNVSTPESVMRIDSESS